MRRLTILSLMVIASLLFIVPGASLGAEKIELGIAGAGPTSLAFTIAAGFAENTNTKTDMVRLTPETTSGFVENVRLLGRGETKLALTAGMYVYQGLRGIGPYKGEPPYVDIRGVAVTYSGVSSFHAREGINSIPELAGKRVTVGPPGSALASFGELALKVYDVKPKQLLHLSMPESGRAFTDGEIDAFMAAAAPYPTVMEAAARKKINILSVDAEHIKKMQEVLPVLSLSYKAGEYEWLKTDVPGIGYVTYIIAHKDVPENIIYEILRVNLSPEGIKYLKNNHRLWNMWSAKMFIEEKNAFAVEGVKLHPGAAKYWKEQGINLPASILP